MSKHVPLDRFPVLVLDMNSTFMFDEDRFGVAEDFWVTYRRVGGRVLDAATVDNAIRAAFGFLDARYADPVFEDDFPSLREAFAATVGHLPADERALLEATFAEHELGMVPDAHIEALRALSARHELRLVSDIWARKDAWIEQLSSAGVLPLFRSAVFSSDTRSVKPSRRLMDAVLEDIACERHEVLMIGDSLERDMRAGRRAGLTTLWVSRSATPSRGGDLVDYQVSSITALAAAFDPTAA